MLAGLGQCHPNILAVQMPEIFKALATLSRTDTASKTKTDSCATDLNTETLLGLVSQEPEKPQAGLNFWLDIYRCLHALYQISLGSKSNSGN